MPSCWCRDELLLGAGLGSMRLLLFLLLMCRRGEEMRGKNLNMQQRGGGGRVFLNIDSITLQGILAYSPFLMSNMKKMIVDITRIFQMTKSQ